MAFIATAALVSAGVAAIGGTVGAISANKQRKKLEEKAAASKLEMDRLKNEYAAIDTSNPFLNMENVYEDATIDQRAAEFQAQQFQQSQANILGGLGEAAGGSGIAALAQQLAQSGQIASQKSAADIGKQEQANQRNMLAEAAKIQTKEREGELKSRTQQRDLAGTLLGMSQQETAAYTTGAMQAQQAVQDSITSGLEGVANAGTSYLGTQQ